MKRAPSWAAGAVIAAAIVGGCAQASTAPDGVVALAFDTLPYPSVVAGDTMRDSLGRATPFHALAYNASGALIANPTIQYLTLDTGVDINAQGYLVATTRKGGTVRVVAAAATLQSLPKTVLITRAPDKLAASGSDADTLRYALPDAASNVSKSLSVKLTRDSAGTPVPVPGFLVSWRLMFRGQAIAPSDTTIASIWDDASRHASILDTTSTDGTASRLLRIRANALPTTADSFVLYATARYRGATVAGSPVKFVIQFRPKT